MVNKRATGYLFQDVGIFLLLAVILTGSLVVANGDSSIYTESVVMFLGVFVGLLFAAFKMNNIAIVIAGFQMLAYSAYKLFFLYAYSRDILPICYVWLLLPLAGVGTMIMFVSGSQRTEIENDVLKEQVEELVMVNPLTGQYNLRSLYNDLRKQISYAERNSLPICLMIVKLRYEPELKKILSRSHYEAVIQKLSGIVEDAVRVEDRIYSIDNNGSLAIMLTCNIEGTSFVENRIKARVNEKEAFEGITDRAIKVEIQIATLQYHKEEFGDDVLAFKQKVESELQYDV